jgi:serine protease Do
VVKVEVARKGGVRKTFNVKLQALNEQPQLAAADQGDSDNADNPGGSAMNRLGINVEPVTADVAQQLQLPSNIRGLVVTDVTPGGPSWQTLYDDPQNNGPDIIISVEDKPVRTEAELRNALKAEKPGSIVSLGIYNPRAQGRRVERIRLADK